MNILNTAESLPISLFKFSKSLTRTETCYNNCKKKFKFSTKATSNLITYICFSSHKICHKFATWSISQLMTFLAFKCITQMLLFEMASLLINIKTKNLSHGTLINLVHTLYFLLLEN